MGSGNIGKEKRALHLKAIDEVTLQANGREVTVSGEDFEKAGNGITGEEQEYKQRLEELLDAYQLEFDFGLVFADATLKEAIKHVKAITKAGINLGVPESSIKGALQTMAIGTPIIKAAINSMDAALQV